MSREMLRNGSVVVDLHLQTLHVRVLAEVPENADWGPCAAGTTGGRNSECNIVSGRRLNVTGRPKKTLTFKDIEKGEKVPK